MGNANYEGQVESTKGGAASSGSDSFNRQQLYSDVPSLNSSASSDTRTGSNSDSSLTKTGDTNSLQGALDSGLSQSGLTQIYSGSDLNSTSAAMLGAQQAALDNGLSRESIQGLYGSSSSISGLVSGDRAGNPTGRSGSSAGDSLDAGAVSAQAGLPPGEQGAHGRGFTGIEQGGTSDSNVVARSGNGTGLDGGTSGATISDAVSSIETGPPPGTGTGAVGDSGATVVSAHGRAAHETGHPPGHGHGHDSSMGSSTVGSDSRPVVASGHPPHETGHPPGHGHDLSAGASTAGSDSGPVVASAQVPQTGHDVSTGTGTTAGDAAVSSATSVHGPQETGHPHTHGHVHDSTGRTVGHPTGHDSPTGTGTTTGDAAVSAVGSVHSAHDAGHHPGHSSLTGTGTPGSDSGAIVPANHPELAHSTEGLIGTAGGDTIPAGRSHVEAISQPGIVDSISGGIRMNSIDQFNDVSQNGWKLHVEEKNGRAVFSRNDKTEFAKIGPLDNIQAQADAMQDLGKMGYNVPDSQLFKDTKDGQEVGVLLMDRADFAKNGSFIDWRAGSKFETNPQMYSDLQTQAKPFISEATQALSAAGYTPDLHGENWGVAQSGFDKVARGEKLTRGDIVIFDPVAGR